jgi:ABC-type bacteriocin/lantibiotic exporter with double-glycine peptidase domain
MSGGARRRALCLVGAVLAGGCAHARTGVPVAPPDARGWIVVPHMRMVAQDGEADCGPAALAMALGRWGATASPDAWQARRGESPPRDGVSAGALRDEARRAGFQAFVFEGSFDDLTVEVAFGHPVIVGLVRLEREIRASHFVVVVGHDSAARRWLIADPALGVEALSRDALEAEWARAGWVTLVLTPNAEARGTRASL